MLNVTRPLRKLFVLGLTLGAVALMAGCSGRTIGARDITPDSAELLAAGSCDAGETCAWYWEYWPAGSPRASSSKKTPVQVAGPFSERSQEFELSTVVGDLKPATTYRWVVCGSRDNGANYVCVGPHGKAGSTTADPPPDYETFTTDPPSGALAEHWNGTNWAIQPIPNPNGALDSNLVGISCTSATACTAVGAYSDRPGIGKAVAEHWNGTRWAVQPTPNPTGARGSSLVGISCTSATACTAVGNYENSVGKLVTLAERWNGTSWTIQPTPNPTGARDSYLGGISCTSATACTAVGSYRNSAGDFSTLAERWNGTAWRIQPTPNPIGGRDFPEVRDILEGVSCTSATACTAVGEYSNRAGKALAEHWNGTRWAVQPTPPTNPTGGQDRFSLLDGVSCTSATACTAVGYYLNLGNHALTERWNGTSWTVQPTPNPTDAYQSTLEGVSCTSATACTAVGVSIDSLDGRKTLAERWNGTGWEIQPTPIPPNHASHDHRHLDGVSCASATACTTIGHN